MKKSELEVRLRNGEIMDNLFHFRLGQDCYMFKADIGEAPDPDEIIYIPDVDLNEIPLDESIPEEDISDIVGYCYTWQDFLDNMEGDAEKAFRLFDYIDWQHPSSAAEELKMDSAEEDDT